MLVGNGYWDRELEKIEVDGDDLYLPTAPGKLVKGIEIDSGIPLQSAAKVPIMITFDVVEKDGDPNEIHCQKCIFKVGFMPWASCQKVYVHVQYVTIFKLMTFVHIESRICVALQLHIATS